MTEMLADAKEWAKTPWNAFRRKKVGHILYHIRKIIIIQQVDFCTFKKYNGLVR